MDATRAVATAAAARGEADAVDVLAGWLLGQAGLAPTAAGGAAP